VSTVQEDTASGAADQPAEQAEIAFGTWIAALISSAGELASEALHVAQELDGPTADTLPRGQAGAYVALVGDEENLQFGVVAQPAVCDAVARALLMLEPDEELSGDDMADALSEVANIVGGGVKRRLATRDRSLKLGLPVFITGDVRPSAQYQTAAVPVTMGGLAVHLLILRHRR